MGTAGIFAVASENEGKHYTTILGRTSDGFKDNLIYMAHLFAETTRALQCLTMVRKNKWSSGVGVVIDAIDAHNQTGWFKDRSKNCAWISWSAIYNPKTGRLDLYEDQFEYHVGYKVVPIGKAKTQGGEGKAIAKAYKEAQKLARMSPADREKHEAMAIRKKQTKIRQKRVKKEAARRRALAKLTPEDRIALGV